MWKNLETGAMFKIQILKFFKEPNGIMNFNKLLQETRCRFLKFGAPDMSGTCFKD
jgi:hypothetical protein